MAAAADADPLAAVLGTRTFDATVGTFVDTEAEPPAAAAPAPAAPGGASSPSQLGLRHTMTAVPTAVTRRSIAMNTASFWKVDGPRGRTTTVGVRGRLGRSAIGTVN